MYKTTKNYVYSLFIAFFIVYSQLIDHSILNDENLFLQKFMFSMASNVIIQFIFCLTKSFSGYIFLLTDQSANIKKEAKMTPKIVDKEEKRHRILEAALGVFAKFGLANTKMIHIAEAAGIGKGTIYEYFKSKEELAIAAFNVFVREADQQVSRKIRSIESADEQLYAYLHAWSDMMDDSFLKYADIMLDVWAESVRIHQGKDIFGMNKMYALYRKQIIDILNRGVAQGVFREMNVTVSAAIIIGTLDGLMIQWLMDKSLFEIRPAFNQLAEMIVSGLRK